MARPFGARGEEVDEDEQSAEKRRISLETRRCRLCHELRARTDSYVWLAGSHRIGFPDLFPTSTARRLSPREYRYTRPNTVVRRIEAPSIDGEFFA